MLSSLENGPRSVVFTGEWTEECCLQLRMDRGTLSSLGNGPRSVGDGQACGCNVGYPSLCQDGRERLVQDALKAGLASAACEISRAALAVTSLASASA